MLLCSWFLHHLIQRILIMVLFKIEFFFYFSFQVLYLAGKDKRKEENTLLQQVVCNIFDVCDKHKVCSISLPAISTGIFGFPLTECARIMAEVVKRHFTERSSAVDVVCIVIKDIKKAKTFANAFSKRIRSDR